MLPEHLAQKLAKLGFFSSLLTPAFHDLIFSLPVKSELAFTKPLSILIFSLPDLELPLGSVHSPTVTALDA